MKEILDHTQREIFPYVHHTTKTIAFSEAEALTLPNVSHLFTTSFSLLQNAFSQDDRIKTTSTSETQKKLLILSETAFPDELWHPALKMTHFSLYLDREEDSITSHKYVYILFLHERR